ncbi:hypothetical protein [Agarilytica rhodophyticola]|uniref:hypothetical protein n=1 Tax=Agarilytica rhodophyticola TaxID=1737490 RepID=UPI000B341902|nr:hypothetical protein [Agarilytica rhodophyticola]
MSQNTTSHENFQSNWSHVSETVNMLYLAVCQIETTMTDANDSVDTLTKSFTHLANHTRDVGHHVENVTEKEDFQDVKEEIAQTTDEIQDNISQAIQAFQFYDRVCQRIDHVARSLEKVSELLSDEDSLAKRPHWKKVQDQIKSSYTMEAERIMFEFIMRGGSVKEALEIYRHHFSAEPEDSNDADEIELF